jgi:hypothetical protein
MQYLAYLCKIVPIIVDEDESVKIDGKHIFLSNFNEFIK